MQTKIPCQRCQRLIQSTTASRNGGLCMPCFNNRDRPEEPYFAIRNSDDLLQAAYQTAPSVFRHLPLSVPRWWIRFRYPNLSRAMATLDQHARLWPFTFNRFTLAMRSGFLAVRDGRPTNVFITELS